VSELTRILWNTFVQVGLSLARIRDGELYREQFDSFEAYCRARWEYGRIYVHYLMSAAQLFTHLVTNCEHRKPERESQLRPLIGLTPDQAKLAWDHAAEKAGEAKITARLVKAAVQELGLGTPKPVNRESRQSKAEKRRLIEETIGQLLLLLRQKAEHAILTEKVQVLHGQIQTLFPKAG
jgi:hypothetical protein